MEKQQLDTTVYYTFLENPRVLILSGMHGDEYESGKILSTWLLQHYQSLPPFVYIPQVSPSAVVNGARKNTYGHDVNRQFQSGTKDPEVLATINIVKKWKFELCIDIHEDPDRTKGFYIYDSETMDELKLTAFRELVLKTGAALFTGIDDVDDENLRRQIDQGYVTMRPEDAIVTSGFSSVWLIKQGITKRTFTLEIPGKADVSMKKSLINTVIPFLFTFCTVQYIAP